MHMPDMDAIITLGCILIWFNCNLSICYLSVLICLIDKTLDSQKMKFGIENETVVTGKGKQKKIKTLDSQKRNLES